MVAQVGNMKRFFAKTTIWYRLKCYVIDTILQIIALPYYINPKTLQPSPLTDEDMKLLEEIYNEDN